MQMTFMGKHAKNKSCRGFTLIELLIAVGIIGIIASIAIPGLLLAQGRALQKSTVAEIRTWGGYLSTYRIDNQGRVPAAFGDFPELHSIISSAYDVRPRDADQWGWVYGYTEKSEGYEFRSFGSDGIPGALFAKDSPPAATFLDIAYENGRFTSHVRN